MVMCVHAVCVVAPEVKVLVCLQCMTVWKQSAAERGELGCEL